MDELLESARLEAGRLRVAAEPFDPAALVVETAEEIRPNAEAKKLALDVVLTAPSKTFTSDPRIVRVIASNLLDNAIKYTDAGRVELSVATTPEGALRISVADTGRGIRPDEQVSVFEPFEQARDPGRKSHGVGLGLALVKQLTQALGGTIELKSTVGVGSTFTVELPSRAQPASVPRALSS